MLATGVGHGSVGQRRERASLEVGDKQGCELVDLALARARVVMRARRVCGRGNGCGPRPLCGCVARIRLRGDALTVKLYVRRRRRRRQSCVRARRVLCGRRWRHWRDARAHVVVTRLGDLALPVCRGPGCLRTRAIHRGRRHVSVHMLLAGARAGRGSRGRGRSRDGLGRCVFVCVRLVASAVAGAERAMGRVRERRAALDVRCR